MDSEVKFKIEKDPEPNGYGGVWRFVPGQTIKGCCDAQEDHTVSEAGYISGGGKDEFGFNVDVRTGILQFEPSDPYYPIIDPHYCPYCGTVIVVEVIKE